MVIWSFPSSSLVTANIDEVYNDHCILFHWPTGKWAHASFGFDAPLDISQAPFGLEDLDALGTLEELTESLDSGLYNNEIIGSQFSVFNSNSRLSTFSGSNLQADLTLARRHIFAPHRQLVEGIYPMCDAPSVKVALGARENIEALSTMTDYVSKEASGIVPFHSSSRMHDVHLRVPAGESWTFMNGFFTDAEKDGEL